jgi:hypothetical protein
MFVQRSSGIMMQQLARHCSGIGAEPALIAQCDGYRPYRSVFHPWHALAVFEFDLVAQGLRVSAVSTMRSLALASCAAPADG